MNPIVSHWGRIQFFSTCWTIMTQQSELVHRCKYKYVNVQWCKIWSPFFVLRSFLHCCWCQDLNINSLQKSEVVAICIIAHDKMSVSHAAIISLPWVDKRNERSTNHTARALSVHKKHFAASAWCHDPQSDMSDLCSLLCALSRVNHGRDTGHVDYYSAKIKSGAPVSVYRLKPTNKHHRRRRAYLRVHF